MDSPPSGGLRDLFAALPALPLFPLPTVLFPGTLLPLHVFEPRYRAMVRDAMDSHRALAVVLILDANRVDRHGHPTIASVAGAGAIVDCAELPSGRLNILVRGRARVRLEELPFVSPYRRARATALPTLPGDVSDADLTALVSAATSFAGRIQRRDRGFHFTVPRAASPGEVADACTQQLVLDARERQAVLETLDAGDRVRRVAEVLALQSLALSPSTEPN